MQAEHEILMLACGCPRKHAPHEQQEHIRIVVGDDRDGGGQIPQLRAELRDARPAADLRPEVVDRRDQADAGP